MQSPPAQTAPPEQFELDLDVAASAESALTRELRYTLVESQRARRVYFRIVQGRGLVITVPRRFPKRELTALIEEQREWALQALADMESRVPAQYRQWPPQRLHLRATGRWLEVVYLPVGGGCEESTGDPADNTCLYWRLEPSLPGCAEPVDTLELTVDSLCREDVARLVAAALKHHAREYLAPRLARFAADAGLRYRRLSIRGQRTLWGSYSSSGTLSLNYKLLFLPPELLDYVLWHELAHTRHLDHSSHFWNLLDRLCPGARSLDHRLGDAGRFVPPWLELAT